VEFALVKNAINNKLIQKSPNWLKMMQELLSKRLENPLRMRSLKGEGKSRKKT